MQRQASRVLQVLPVKPAPGRSRIPPCKPSGSASTGSSGPDAVFDGSPGFFTSTSIISLFTGAELITSRGVHPAHGGSAAHFAGLELDCAPLAVLRDDFLFACRQDKPLRDSIYAHETRRLDRAAAGSPQSQFRLIVFKHRRSLCRQANSNRKADLSQSSHGFYLIAIDVDPLHLFVALKDVRRIILRP